MKGIRVSTIAKVFNLYNLTPMVDLEQVIISAPATNRAALQLTGYYEHFDNDRIQIIGSVEYHYMQNKMTEKEQLACYDELFKHGIPCLIFCRNFAPVEGTIELATSYGIPVLQSEGKTTQLISSMIHYLSLHLGPSLGLHGVLVDVYGEGVLIEGESGIGKSEIALELIKRGHRLVSDDVVDIKKVNDGELIGRAPAITKYFIELRGIGILNVKNLFGVGSVKDTQTIDMIIKLEKWNESVVYDRIGLSDSYDSILGVQIPQYKIPVSPGRNVAIIIESAAMNHRQKKMGYNAAEELNQRFMEKMRTGKEDDIL